MSRYWNITNQDIGILDKSSQEIEITSTQILWYVGFLELEIQRVKKERKKQMQTKSQPARKSCSMCPGTVGRGRLWHFPDGEFPSLWCLPPVSTPPLLDGPDAPEKASNYFPQVLFKSDLKTVEQILPGCPAISKWKPCLGISTRALERSFPQVPILPKFVLEASASKQKLRWDLWFVFSWVQVNTYGWQV